MISGVELTSFWYMLVFDRNDSPTTKRKLKLIFILFSFKDIPLIYKTKENLIKLILGKF